MVNKELILIGSQNKVRSVWCKINNFESTACVSRLVAIASTKLIRRRNCKAKNMDGIVLVVQDYILKLKVKHKLLNAINLIKIIASSCCPIV